MNRDRWQRLAKRPIVRFALGLAWIVLCSVTVQPFMEHRSNWWALLILVTFTVAAFLADVLVQRVRLAAAGRREEVPHTPS